MAILQEPIVMGDNAPVYKKVSVPVREDLRMRYPQHPPNSPDLNPIENIWTHIKHRIAKEYAHITSVKTMKQVVIQDWDEWIIGGII